MENSRKVNKVHMEEVKKLKEEGFAPIKAKIGAINGPQSPQAPPPVQPDLRP